MLRHFYAFLEIVVQIKIAAYQGNPDQVAIRDSLTLCHLFGHFLRYFFYIFASYFFINLPAHLVEATSTHQRMGDIVPIAHGVVAHKVIDGANAVTFIGKHGKVRQRKTVFGFIFPVFPDWQQDSKQDCYTKKKGEWLTQMHGISSCLIQLYIA